MTTIYRRIALAGAKGHVGSVILAALLRADFDVTVLTRGAGIEGIPSSVRVAQVDYSSVGSLTAALRGQDVFLSNLPNMVDQRLVIDACIAAGVKRFVPSDYGSDVPGSAKVAELPIFATKAATVAYLREKAAQGRISWTSIVNGLFLDWCLERGFLLGLPHGKAVTVLDGGDEPRSMTLITELGKAVVGVLRHPDETRDRAVYVQSVGISHNRLLEIATKTLPNFAPKIEYVTSDELVRKGQEQLEEDRNAGRKSSATATIFLVSLMGNGYSNDFSGKNDNELLEIEQLSDEQVGEVIAKCAQ